MKNQSRLRFLLMSGAILLFSGLLVFSIFKVRFSVQGAEKNEFNVIQYSLTDSIERRQGDTFTLTLLDKPSGKGESGKTQPKPCPT